MFCITCLDHPGFFSYQEGASWSVSRQLQGLVMGSARAVILMLGKQSVSLGRIFILNQFWTIYGKVGGTLLWWAVLQTCYKLVGSCRKIH